MPASQLWSRDRNNRRPDSQTRQRRTIPAAKAFFQHPGGVPGVTAMDQENDGFHLICSAQLLHHPQNIQRNAIITDRCPDSKNVIPSQRRRFFADIPEGNGDSGPFQSCGDLLRQALCRAIQRLIQDQTVHHGTSLGHETNGPKPHDGTGPEKAIPLPVIQFRRSDRVVFFSLAPEVP